MPDNFIELATTQYSTNLRLRLQQQASLLRGKVMEGFHVGKMASPVDYVAPVSMKAPTGRFAPLNRTDTSYMRRWVVPQDKELAQLVDQFDRLRTLEDPNAALTQSAASAVGRTWDDAIIAAAFAPATLGTDNGSLTSETFSTSTYGISDTFGDGSTSIGMTVDKLIEARRIFRHNHVDLETEELTLVIGSWQEAEMLKLTEISSSEFNKLGAVVNDGRLQRFLGWNIVVSERLNYGTGISGASNCRQCIAFVKSGMYLGVWLDMQNNISKQTELSGQPWQIYTAMTYGATRLEPGRVLRIDCGNDTSGADPANAITS